jgi:peptide/nickel transport system ATP-binding protein
VSRVYGRPRSLVNRRGRQVRALDDITLTVRRGERLGIVGESGSGKSTLIRLVAGLDNPTTGSVHVDGRRVSGRPERELGFLREQVQFVFQDPMSSLDPRMTIHDIIAEPLRTASAAERSARVHELLDAVGIPRDAARRYPHQFSGGQRQRISIARALAPGPSILIADEPVSALDVSVRAQVLNLLADLVDELALTLLFVSHDLAVVRHVCDRVAVMHHGELVEVAPTEQIYSDAAAPYTKQLIAASATLHDVLARGTASSYS